MNDKDDTVETFDKHFISADSIFDLSNVGSPTCLGDFVLAKLC